MSSRMSGRRREGDVRVADRHRVDRCPAAPSRARVSQAPPLSEAAVQKPGEAAEGEPEQAGGDQRGDVEPVDDIAAGVIGKDG